MLGHLIYNYEHSDDLRIQQEISKRLYDKAFGGVHLVHCYNGERSFGYQPYLEDKLIVLKNKGHYLGATELINAGLNFFIKTKIKGLKYVLVTAADTWIVNINFLKKLIAEMERDGRVLAASSWGKVKYPERPLGFSTDFFIIDIEWNRKTKLFPIDFASYRKKFGDYFALQYYNPILEGALQYKFQKYFMNNFKDNNIWLERNRRFRRIIEREPVHNKYGKRYMAWPKIGLYTSPTPERKQRVLRKLKVKLGPYAGKLIAAKNLSYYNANSTN